MNINEFVSDLGFRFCNAGRVDSNIYESALQVYNDFSALCFADASDIITNLKEKLYGEVSDY